MSTHSDSFSPTSQVSNAGDSTTQHSEPFYRRWLWWLVRLLIQTGSRSDRFWSEVLRTEQPSSDSSESYSFREFLSIHAELPKYAEGLEQRFPLLHLPQILSLWIESGRLDLEAFREFLRARNKASLLDGVGWTCLLGSWRANQRYWRLYHSCRTSQVSHG